MAISTALFSEFPKGRLATPSDLKVLLLKEKLRVILDELTWRVQDLWRQNNDDELLGIASTYLLNSGLSVQSDPVLLGRFVVRPMRCYWEKYELIPSEAATRLLDIADNDTYRLLKQAIQVDTEIRKVVTE